MKYPIEKLEISSMDSDLVMLLKKRLNGIVDLHDQKLMSLQNEIKNQKFEV